MQQKTLDETAFVSPTSPSQLLPSPTTSTWQRDLTAGLVVFLVTLPLCLGEAASSNAKPFSGLLAGIIGGIVVGVLSRSQTSVSGPAAGLAAIVAAEIGLLGSFSAFLLALVLAGFIQIGFGMLRLGFLAGFFPSSVIKGLLAAIGLILILKQIPHILGHDTDPEGDMSFVQPDHLNTFSELGTMLGDVQFGAAVIGVLSIAILVCWDRVNWLKKLPIPAPLIVIAMGVGLTLLFSQFGGRWLIEAGHRVQVPMMSQLKDWGSLFEHPDFSQWRNPAIYSVALVIALAASLESLLNLEAIDKIDPKQRTSPASRELAAQGVGNVLAGLLGGIPVTSVIVRGSININAGATTKLAAIVHGVLMLVCVFLFPSVLNLIPLSCLAAILLMTGVQLISPTVVKQMWNGGRGQLIPFVVTIVAILLTDLFRGTMIGLVVSVLFILHGNLKRPLRSVVEKHLGGDVVHIELANQVSFLNRAALTRALNDVPRGTHVLLDARNTVYIDQDVVGLLRDFKDQTAPVRGVLVSLLGFREPFDLSDKIEYVDYSSKEVQSRLSPEQVLQIFKDGNERFRTGNHLTRDLGRQVNATSEGQFPLAVVLSCIDSRTPVELVFDLGLGDIFSVRIAGNITSEKVLGSIEYGCAVAGAKLILVMGHTRCGAVGAAVNFACTSESAAVVTGCQHLDHVVSDIQRSVDAESCANFPQLADSERQAYIDNVARRNVLTTIKTILQQSSTISKLVQDGRVAVVGGMYDVTSGTFEFL